MSAMSDYDQMDSEVDGTDELFEEESADEEHWNREREFRNE